MSSRRVFLQNAKNILNCPKCRLTISLLGAKGEKLFWKTAKCSVLTVIDAKVMFNNVELFIISKTEKMPLPVYEKVFSAAENGFISRPNVSIPSTGDFKFKKQQFELEDLQVISLQSIRNLNLHAPIDIIRRR